jgi:hypothetical protein
MEDRLMTLVPYYFLGRLDFGAVSDISTAMRAI